jgi:hypothetical protein|tara:strand:- start:7520 stop:7870 length:351 start_codon:yes stop_codon:yes gene_type:complete
MRQIDEGEFYELIERSIDAAVRSDGKFLFKVYPYLKTNQWKRTQVNRFIESSTAAEINDVVMELTDYIKGGDKQLLEAYGHIPKPKARKIKDYLYGMLNDAWTYHAERRPGRKSTK